MADNVAITPGTGATVAADDIAGVMHQRVKLSLGADGTAVDAVGGTGVDSTGVQRVSLATNVALPAGENHMGRINGYAFDVTVTPTVTSGAYSAGDIVGALMTFTVARVNDEPVIINRVQVAVKAAVTSTLTLILFNADPSGTTKTDNAAYSLAAADAFKVIAAIPINALGGYLTDHGTPNTYELNNLNIPCKPVSGGTAIYGLLIDGTGWTLTSTSDIQVRVAGVGA